jgi:hypothetical protein
MGVAAQRHRKRVITDVEQAGWRMHQYNAHWPGAQKCCRSVGYA